MTFLDWGKDSKRSVWFLLKYLLIILWWLCMNILSSPERENGEKLWLNLNGGSRLAHDVPLRCHYCFVSFDASLLWYVLSNKPKSLKKRSSMGRLFISSSWRAFLSSFIRAQECFSTVSPQCRVPAARAVWIFCRPARSGEGVLRVSGLPESPRLRNPLPPCKVSCAAFVSCYFGVGDLLFFFFFSFYPLPLLLLLSGSSSVQRKPPCSNVIEVWWEKTKVLAIQFLVDLLYLGQVIGPFSKKLVLIK